MKQPCQTGDRGGQRRRAQGVDKCCPADHSDLSNVREGEDVGDDGEQDNRRDDELDQVQEKRAKGSDIVLRKIRMGLQEEPCRDGKEHRNHLFTAHSLTPLQ